MLPKSPAVDITSSMFFRDSGIASVCKKKRDYSDTELIPLHCILRKLTKLYYGKHIQLNGHFPIISDRALLLVYIHKLTVN